MNCSQVVRLRRTNACEGCCPGPLFREFFIFPVGQCAFGFLREDYSPKKSKRERIFCLRWTPSGCSCATGSAAPIHVFGVCLFWNAFRAEARERVGGTSSGSTSGELSYGDDVLSRADLSHGAGNKRSCSRAYTGTVLLCFLVAFRSLAPKCIFEFECFFFALPR